MSEKDAKQWRKLTLLFPPTDEERDFASQLYQQFIKGHSWQLSDKEILDLSLPIIFDFYYRLALFTTPGRVYSRKQTTNWFSSMHVNMLDLRKISGWMGLLKMAPMFNHQAIVLEPFCTCHDHNSQLILSHITLDSTLHSHTLSEANISLEEFLPLVFEGLRRLKIAVGFILYPFVSSHAIVYEKKPEIFHVDETSTETSNKIFFELENKESMSYLTRLVDHYKSTYSFDFVYYPLNEMPYKISALTLDSLEQIGRETPSFAVLGVNSFPIHSVPPYLLPLSTEYFPLAKMSMQKTSSEIFSLLYFLGKYTTIFPHIIDYASIQQRPLMLHLYDYPLLPVFDQKNTCLNFDGYTLWVWGSKHKVSVLLAVWSFQEHITIDLDVWVRTHGFYQQILWAYTGRQLQQVSDELVSSAKVEFTGLEAGDARILLLNI